jgi:hypothetical protein
MHRFTNVQKHYNIWCGLNWVNLTAVQVQYRFYVRELNFND